MAPAAFDAQVAGALGDKPASRPENFFARMLLVRRFEERVLELFDEGVLAGTTHCAIGQEADAVAVIEPLRPDDLIFSNHRCHGHYLARTGDAVGLLAELMGRAGGVCGGRGGSQHLCNGTFFTNGIQGNLTPVAAGAAYAEKRRGAGTIAVLFLGDGTFGQGVVYETFNLISLWQAPLLVVVENNRWAQTTPLAKNFAGDFVARARAFDLSAGETAARDVIALHAHFTALIDTVRNQQRPHVEVIHTYRYCAHSKSDDHRPADEIDAWRETDPLAALEATLDPTRRDVLADAVGAFLREAEAAARAMAPAVWEATDG